VAAAAEMYKRVGSVDKVLKMFIQSNDWDEVFSIAKLHPELKKEAYFPYAQWLAESDRFAEAQKGKLETVRVVESSF
jgi:intraflagellar transport protein 122